MNVEDFPAAAEIANHIEDFPSRILQHFRDRALAKVQPMIRTRMDFDKALQSIYATEHCVDSAEAFVARHSGIVWVASHAHFIFLGYGNHAIQKISDTFPVGILVDRPGFGEWRILPGLIGNEGAVPATAA